MTIYFKLDKTDDGRPMVEVWDDDKFIAGIYPHENSINIVSKYLGDVSVDRKNIPSAMLFFETQLRVYNC